MFILSAKKKWPELLKNNWRKWIENFFPCFYVGLNQELQKNYGIKINVLLVFFYSYFVLPQS